jgi:hypothetical protein
MVQGGGVVAERLLQKDAHHIVKRVQCCISSSRLLIVLNVPVVQTLQSARDYVTKHCMRHCSSGRGARAGALL